MEMQKDRPDILNDKNVKKEIRKLKKMFDGIEDEDRKTLVNSLIEEAAFLKVALTQAKEELKAEGLTAETKKRFAEVHKSPPFHNNL